jgi:hypothetical protein
MKTKRLPKTADQKELDHLWGVLVYAAEIKELRLCAHLLTQIAALEEAVKEIADAPIPKPRGRPRKAKAVEGNGQTADRPTDEVSGL